VCWSWAEGSIPYYYTEAVASIFWWRVQLGLLRRVLHDIVGDTIGLLTLCYGVFTAAANSALETAMETTRAVTSTPKKLPTPTHSSTRLYVYIKQ
jgi:hypothetical protein